MLTTVDGLLNLQKTSSNLLSWICAVVSDGGFILTDSCPISAGTRWGSNYWHLQNYNYASHLIWVSSLISCFSYWLQHRAIKFDHNSNWNRTFAMRKHPISASDHPIEGQEDARKFWKLHSNQQEKTKKKRKSCSVLCNDILCVRDAIDEINEPRGLEDGTHLESLALI